MATTGLVFDQMDGYGSYLAAASRKVWASWKAIDIVASAVSSTARGLYRTGTTDPAENAELGRLLEWPNKRETFSDFLYRLTFHLKATGNAYAYKAEATIKGDRPRELILLNPRRVKISVDRGSGEIVGYLYHREGGTPVPLSPAEVVHWFRPHPNNDYYGLGDIEAGEELVQDALNHQTWAKSFWRNGAAPSGILVCEDYVTDEEEWERAKAKWQREYGGMEKAGRTAWLTGKWRYEKLGLTGQEMQDIERSRLSVEHIFLLHGVPLSVAGIREAANYATAEIDDDRFRRYTVGPILRNIEETFNSDVTAGFGRFELKFQPQAMNPGQIMSVVVAAFDRGLISINEGRAMLGFPKDEGNPAFEAHFINAGLVPLELVGVPMNLEEAQRAAREITTDFVRRSLNGNGRNGHEDILAKRQS